MFNLDDFNKELQKIVYEKVNLLLASDDIKDNINFYISDILPAKISQIINEVVGTKAVKDNISEKVDVKFSNEILSLLDTEVKSKVSASVSKVDLGTEISKEIHEYIDNRMRKANLPHDFIPFQSIDWDGYTISSEKINLGQIKNFNSTGIADRASSNELLIENGAVVIQNNLLVKNANVSENLTVNSIDVDTIKINSLSLTEKSASQLKSIIVDQFSILSEDKNLDISGVAVVSNGKEILTEDTLGNSVFFSNLRKVGRLSSLTTEGDTSLSNTLFISANGKIGIDTQEPLGKFTLFDDDTELTIKRFAKKQMYIGTSTDSELVIGVNNSPVIKVNKNNQVELDTMVLGGLQISVSDVIPDWNGVAGEIIFMKNINDESPWAYRCLGNNVWKAITY